MSNPEIESEQDLDNLTVKEFSDIGLGFFTKVELAGTNINKFGKTSQLQVHFYR